MRLLVLAAALAAVACGGLPVQASPSPGTPAPSRSAAASPAPSPTAITSAKGTITVTRPLANERVRPQFTISGEASVFEATVQWRVVDSGGRVLAQGFTAASAGAPQRGAFTITPSLAPPATDTIAIVEVFSRSPRDGSVDDIVVVPVVVTP